MAVYSNKTKKGAKKGETKPMPTKSRINTTYEVEQISNGFIVSKRRSGEDEKGNWVSDCVKTYHEKNPVDL